jgi:3-hydroxyacyl-CoA dehydrogenase
LLLPLEAEIFRNMAAGYGPEVVNLCSVSALLPLKQLDFMDAVGLDVIYASVCNYTERMAADEEESYATLRFKLGEIVQSGKRGNKSKNGILCGERVTWSNEEKNLSAGEKRELATIYLHLVINTCLRFVERGRVKQATLDTVLTTVFQSEIGLLEALQQEGADKVYNTMETAYRETGLSYFKPSRQLERVR